MLRFIFPLFCIASLNAQSLSIAYEGAFFTDGKLVELMRMRDNRNPELSKKMAEHVMLRGPRLGLSFPIRNSPFRLTAGYAKKEKVFTAELPYLGGVLKDEVLIRQNAIQGGLEFSKKHWGLGASLDFVTTEWRTQSKFLSNGLSLASEKIDHKALTLYAETGFLLKTLKLRFRPYVQRSLKQVDFSALNEQLDNPSTADTKSNLLNVGIQAGITF